MEKYVIDRIEENFFVLENEDGKVIDVEKILIPGGKEGDVVAFEKGEYFVLEEETQKRKAIISEKIKRVFGKK